MQNRFGLKDFVLLVAVIAVGVLVFLAMVQDDRTFKKIAASDTRIGSLETQLSRIEAGMSRAGGEQMGELAQQIGALAESQTAQAKAIGQLSLTMNQSIDELKELVIASASGQADLQDRIAALQAKQQDERKALEDQIAAMEQQAEQHQADLASAGGVGDTSWARPDVPIQWQPAYGFATDPRDQPDYRVGGEFREVFEAQPAKLVPVLGEDVYSRRIQDQVFEGLAAYDAKTLEFHGVLAEAWQYDPAGYWLRVKLRPGIRFSDGVPITADDVVYSFHGFVNNPELETESLRSIMTQIKAYTKIRDDVVEITFNEPNAYNLQAALDFYVLPKHFYEQFTPRQINQATGLMLGSGPFKMQQLDPDDQWTPGEDVVLVRNEQYWGPRPALASLRYRVINNEQGRLTAYTNGEADMVLPSSPQFAELTARPDWDETTYSLKWVNMRSGYSFIGWQCGPRNGTLTPFHDKRVRLAMTHTFDRDRMIRDIWSGIGEVATGPVNNPSPAADPDMVPWAYDLDKARALLADAGWVDRDDDGILENERGDEFEFEFTRASGGQVAERISKYIKDQCAKVGIRCNVRVVDWSLYDQILKTRDFDAIIMGWSASTPESDPSQIWHTDSIENQGHNFIQWDAGQDRIIEAIRTELDYDKRMELFHEFHRLCHDEQPYTFVRVAPWLRFVKKDFKNVRGYPTGLEQREYYIGPSYSRGL